MLPARAPQGQFPGPWTAYTGLGYRRTLPENGLQAPAATSAPQPAGSRADVLGQPDPVRQEAPHHCRQALSLVTEHNGGRKEGTQGLISALNTPLANFGISTEIAPDRGLERTASATKRSLRDYPPPTSHTPTMY